MLAQGGQDACGRPRGVAWFGGARQQAGRARKVLVADRRLQVVQPLGHVRLLLDRPQQRALRLQVVACMAGPDGHQRTRQWRTAVSELFSCFAVPAPLKLALLSRVLA